jgi:hypothetical protein
MWLGDCGNLFIHEIGHTLSLSHFVSGSSARRGITEEYPNDGVNMEYHPWGYDTYKRKFRTWYRVDNNGPVITETGETQGKKDPMNGGESANTLTCFP